MVWFCFGIVDEGTESAVDGVVDLIGRRLLVSGRSGVELVVFASFFISSGILLGDLR